MNIRRLLAISVLAISACSLTGTAGVPLLPTATTVRVVPATVVPTVNRTVGQVPTLTPGPTITAAPLEDCRRTAGISGTQHIVTANLNYAQRALLVQQTLRYINRTNDPLNQIVMSVEANQWPGAFRLNDLIVEMEPAGYDLTGRRLVVELPQVLEPGCGLELRLNFQLTVPQIGEGIAGYRGFLGHSPRQINLGNWLPVIAPRLDGEWAFREAVLIGEQTVLDMADWDVTINVSSGPDALEIAGPGEVTRTGERTWQFIVHHARDFTLSLSEEFRVSRAETASGIVVELYAFDDAQVTTDTGVVVDSAAHALDVAVKSLAMFEDLYGPYEQRRLAVVEGDFPDGMEFSGLVFVSRDWFTRFTGDPAAYLTIITVHEVAHQWWYAAVGSDQALTPWLDEALATYSEVVFIEEYYPDLKDWWWDWRVNNYAPSGFVDSSVYQFSSIREYINTVYLLGARMLDDLRTDLGTDVFFEVLRRYYESGRGRVVSSSVFWSALTPEEQAATLLTRQRYLRLQTGIDSDDAN